MGNDLRFSRPMATAERLGELAADRHRFVDKQVLVTGETSVLLTANGRECLLASLRLLIRICPYIAVTLPPDCADILEEVRATIEPLAFGAPLTYSLGYPEPDLFDATLCVGATAQPEARWTVINSNGWLARVSSGPAPLSSECGQANPIGALAAASLGVTEVFKRLVRLKSARGNLLDDVSFSLFSYAVDKADPGPVLPDKLRLDLLIGGAGAIGNGVVYLLSRLPVAGTVWIVDKQEFGDENLGTCILIGPADIGKAKALVAEEWLRPYVEAHGYLKDLATHRTGLGKDAPYPQLIVGALDNVEARHELQKFWPDVAIDGAIGDFMCQVSRHAWNEDTACLMCLFRQPLGRAAEQVASDVTGLSVARARDADDVVTEDDMRTAPFEKQGWLRERIGRQICSVIQEGVAQKLSDDQQLQGFQPSVPFVACLSASMVVAEVVKAVAGWPSSIEPRFQFDALHGPGQGTNLGQGRRKDCLCTMRRANIDTLRQRRGLSKIQ